MLPVMEPGHNLREIVKQLLLLEDHLFHPQKRCPDCITKHLLTAEALAEEMASLDVENEFQRMSSLLSEALRAAGKDLADGTDPTKVSQRIRNIRKPLMGVVRMASKRGPCKGCVAWRWQFS